MTPFEHYCWRRVPELAVAQYLELKPRIEEIWAKEANWPQRALELGQLLPAEQPLPLGIPSHPSPLLGSLVGGLAGAGLGYGLGYAGEQFLPRHWRRGPLRNALAVLGGGLGATPGLSMMAMNHAGGKPWNDVSMFSVPATEHGHEDMLNAARGYQQAHPKNNLLMMPAGDMHHLPKQGDFSGASSAFAFDPDAFNELVWSDPHLEPPLQAAASGLVTGAANLTGKKTRLVTPGDVGRIAAGMGSGYLSGALVGKALGLIVGMPDSTQSKLRNAGMLAGLIQNLVPIAFGA